MFPSIAEIALYSIIVWLLRWLISNYLAVNLLFDHT
jgi:hypothetical protein